MPPSLACCWAWRHPGGGCCRAVAVPQYLLLGLLGRVLQCWKRQAGFEIYSRCCRLSKPVCCRGSQDATISKTLFLHLPTRHPSSYPELDISPLVQAAALAGVGLLFQGTCHR